MDQPRSITVLQRKYPRTGRYVPNMGYATGESCNPDDHYLPVAREEGKYYAGGSKYCGTFYYYEPDSQNTLGLGESIIAGNKIDAALQLEGLTGLFESNGSLSNSIAIPGILAIVDRFLPGKLARNWRVETDMWMRNHAVNPEFFEHINRVFSTREGRRILDNIVNFSRVAGTSAEMDDIRLQLTDGAYLNSTYHLVTGKKSTYRGTEFMKDFDYLDQHLCRLAADAGINTIVLQREPGENYVSTEIYDTRDRQDSYGKICKSINTKLVDGRVDYPTIWFESYGFLRFA